MRRIVLCLGVGLAACLGAGSADGRGYGGGFSGGMARGGYGGYDRGGMSGYGSYGRTESGGYSHGYSSFSGMDRAGGSYSGSRSVNSFSGYGERGASGSYDRTYTDRAGGSVTTSGTRGVEEGRYGGVAAGGTRDTTVTTAGGKSYTADRSGAVASGPMGRTVGGASGSVDGRYGSGSWNTAFAGNRYGDMTHYSSLGATTAHGTSYWSGSYMTTRGADIRGTYAYPNCFHPAWYAAHPGCWAATGWAAGAAYTSLPYASLAGYCGLDAAAAPDYDYGSTIVVNDSTVSMNGTDAGVTPEQFADQAQTLATAGQQNPGAPTEEWKPLGVFALVEGKEASSNNLFQLAINKNGTIRGNYYDGLTDTSTEVFGSIDKVTQRAAWTIGKKGDRVFEAGVYNLTQPQCTCLVHVGAQKTLQMMLVRMDPPKTTASK